MAERIVFVDPVYGIGLRIDAGSGPSWIEVSRQDGQVTMGLVSSW